MGKNLLSTEEKKDLVKWYIEVKNDKNVKNKYKYVKENYELKYHPKVPPTKKTVLNNVKIFNKFGSVINRQKHTPHKKTVVTEENIKKVKSTLESGSGKSVRDIELKTNIGRESVRFILNEELKLFPYKVQIMQKIPENSIKKRLDFCTKMIQKLQLDPNLLNNIWFSDESHFYLDGHCNKQNMRIWGSEKPEKFIEKSAHPLYVTVWCAISAQGFIGPYFFENSNQERIIVNQTNYQNMIENYFVPELRKRVGDRFNEQIFMQDTSPHTAKKTMELLEKIFGGKIISIKSTDIWPPYSPDLNPCDYFLWGFLKDRVFSENVGNISLLKEKIKQVCSEITEEMCERVLNNLRFRLNYCTGSSF